MFPLSAEKPCTLVLFSVLLYFKTTAVPLTRFPYLFFYYIFYVLLFSTIKARSVQRNAKVELGFRQPLLAKRPRNVCAFLECENPWNACRTVMYRHVLTIVWFEVVSDFKNTKFISRRFETHAFYLRFSNFRSTFRKKFNICFSITNKNQSIKTKK